MKRPSGLVLGVLGAITAFILVELYFWWPAISKKREEPAAEPAVAAEAPAPTFAPPSEPTVAAAAPAARPGRTIQELHSNESDELRRLEGCSDKKCGDPCIFRCNESEDGRCKNGRRPGACTVTGECSTTLPAVCPSGQDEVPASELAPP
jgi:hypothetical protein